MRICTVLHIQEAGLPITCAYAISDLRERKQK
jgi:hypothetical protein